MFTAAAKKLVAINDNGSIDLQLGAFALHYLDDNNLVHIFPSPEIIRDALRYDKEYGATHPRQKEMIELYGRDRDGFYLDMLDVVLPSVRTQNYSGLGTALAVIARTLDENIRNYKEDAPMRPYPRLAISSWYADATPGG